MIDLMSDLIQGLPGGFPPIRPIGAAEINFSGMIAQ
jgi:hypothetical protein